MDKKKTTKALYIVSTVMFGILFLMGAGAIVYANSRPVPADLEWQTMALIMAIAGPIGMVSYIKPLKGDTPAMRNLSIAVQCYALVCSVSWLAFIYFISVQKPDAFTQAATWLITIGVVTGLVRLLTGRRK